MYRQKGTGNARAGHKRSGIRRGGGHIHRIHNRDYSYRLPRKALQAATRMALAAKVRDDELIVIDDLAFTEPRTKDMAAVLKHLDWKRPVAAGGHRQARCERLPQCPQHRRRVGVARPATSTP